MRILYDSKLTQFKNPFGTLTPSENCVLNIYIPSSVQAKKVTCRFLYENGSFFKNVDMSFAHTKGAYDAFTGNFSFDSEGLYFYYFYIETPDNAFSLYKQGDDTNMEAGDWWQVSCIPNDFTTPDWAKGATMYQVFPDRFNKSGECDLSRKLKPFKFHRNWYEEVDWRPTKEGLVLNNDFFGGNFKGITEKMDYFVSLGIDILYLNPISMSFSSHRYDTGDYKTPDPMLGTEEDFVAMCEAAHANDIRVILDGVFSHTGSNSLYFDKDRTFGGNGAYCTTNSPFYSWYQFTEYPNKYKSWWGFDTLPTVQKMDPAFIRYIISDEDSVVAHWLRLGADGFRLDVVDELPNEFVALLKKRIREVKSDAFLVGEVWEDASNKIAYDIRKRYFVDGVLDSAMNYPFRTAILNFMRGWDDGKALRNTVMMIVENYPPQVVNCNMNMLGTHDTPRILTALVDDYEGSREENAKRKLTYSQRAIATEKLYLASLLQYSLPGIPSLYYGDEAGMEGAKDPFNRRTYPWGNEDTNLLAHYRRLGSLRKHPAIRKGSIEFFHSSEHRLGFVRQFENKKLRIYLNNNTAEWEIPSGRILLAHNINTVAPNWLTISAMGFCIIEEGE